MKTSNYVRAFVFFVALITALAAAHASDFGSFTYQSYGGTGFGQVGHVSVTDTRGGSYQVARTAGGDYWGGYRTVSSRGNVNGGSFGYDNERGITSVNVYNPSVRAHVYQTVRGTYGGSVAGGNRQVYQRSMNSYSYPYNSGYSQYAPRAPNYYGNSLY